MSVWSSLYYCGRRLLSVSLLIGLLILGSAGIAWACDNGVPEGGEARNAGNGCAYRCVNGGWEGPIWCDGQGNGQFQGEAARSEADRQVQTNAVAESLAEAAAQLAQQSPEETAQHATNNANQRALEAIRQQAMVESQRQAAVASGVSAAEAAARSSAASANVSQAAGTTQGSSLVGSGNLLANQLAASGYGSPEQALAAAGLSGSNVAGAAVSQAVNPESLGGSCDLNTGAAGSQGVGGVCCRGGVAECGADTNGACMSTLDRPGVVGVCGAAGSQDISGFCGDSFCNGANENANSCEADCRNVAAGQSGNALFLREGGKCVSCPSGKENSCGTYAECLRGETDQPLVEAVTLTPAQQRQMDQLTNLADQCRNAIYSEDDINGFKCTNRYLEKYNEVAQTADGKVVTALITERREAENHIYDLAANLAEQNINCEQAIKTGSNCLMNLEDYELGYADALARFAKLYPERAAKVESNSKNYQTYLDEEAGRALDTAKNLEQRFEDLATEVQSQCKGAGSLDEVTKCVDRKRNVVEAAYQNYSDPESSFCQRFPKSCVSAKDIASEVQAVNVDNLYPEVEGKYKPDGSRVCRRNLDNLNNCVASIPGQVEVTPGKPAETSPVVPPEIPTAPVVPTGLIAPSVPDVPSGSVRDTGSRVGLTSEQKAAIDGSTAETVAPATIQGFAIETRVNQEGESENICPDNLPGGCHCGTSDIMSGMGCPAGSTLGLETYPWRCPSQPEVSYCQCDGRNVLPDGSCPAGSAFSVIYGSSTNEQEEAINGSAVSLTPPETTAASSTVVGDKCPDTLDGKEVKRCNCGTGDVKEAIDSGDSCPDGSSPQVVLAKSTPADSTTVVASFSQEQVNAFGGQVINALRNVGQNITNAWAGLFGSVTGGTTKQDTTTTQPTTSQSTNETDQSTSETEFETRPDEQGWDVNICPAEAADGCNCEGRYIRPGQECRVHLSLTVLSSETPVQTCPTNANVLYCECDLTTRQPGETCPSTAKFNIVRSRQNVITDLTDGVRRVAEQVSYAVNTLARQYAASQLLGSIQNALGNIMGSSSKSTTEVDQVTTTTETETAPIAELPEGKTAVEVRNTPISGNQLLDGGKGLGNGSTQDNGNFQLEGYCQVKNTENMQYTGAISDNAGNWFCTNESGAKVPLTPTDMDVVCGLTYKTGANFNSDAVAVFVPGLTGTPAYNWRCGSRSGSPPPIETSVDEATPVKDSQQPEPVLLMNGTGLSNDQSVTNGKMQVEGYCTDQGYGIKQDNTNWYCTDAQNNAVKTLTSTDFNQICQETYNDPSAFAVQDGADSVAAYNWNCYGYNESSQ